ncbi:MAG TPA: hypothetical protein VGJ21_10305 [Terracidiphilus sp.]|jgi:hypothetical protein
MNSAPPAQKETNSYWWPKTDTIERAREAAKGGFVAFAFIAYRLLPNALAVFKGQRLSVTDYMYDGATLLLTALPIYLAWVTYKRPNLFLNCLAFFLIALSLAAGVLGMLASNGTVVGPMFLPLIGAVAAIGGIRGSIALRRFSRQGPAT